MRIEHIGLWVKDLERMRDFYVTQLGGQAGPLYENPRKGFRSYFISFDNGARLELMSQVGRQESPASLTTCGYAHLAFALPGKTAVDETVRYLEAAGYVITGRPRTTGDGYYEAVAQDPEGNLIELVCEPSQFAG